MNESKERDHEHDYDYDYDYERIRVNGTLFVTLSRFSPSTL